MVVEDATAVEQSRLRHNGSNHMWVVVVEVVVVVAIFVVAVVVGSDDVSVAIESPYNAVEVVAVDMVVAVDTVVARQPFVVAVVDNFHRVYRCVSGIVVSRVCDSWAHSKSGQNVCT